MSQPACRNCGEALVHTFVDLGITPLCESYVAADALDEPEVCYPLHARVCHRCYLVQVPSVVPAEAIFSDYAYFSSYSTSWVEHARRFVRTMIDQLGLGPSSLVVEVASNDGYLLRHAVEAGVPVLGIEPAANVAEAAVAAGVPTVVRFFGETAAAELAADVGRADLLVGNNVFAHVPDLHDFTAGLATLLAPDGVLSLEFPHLQRLVEGNQFDTIYHEHFSYFSFAVARAVLAAHGLEVFDVEELASHGGSLRVLAAHAGRRPVAPTVDALVERERTLGYLDPSLDVYRAFEDRVVRTKHAFVGHLVAAAEAGRTVGGYGAPGKGNTLLNACGIKPDLLAFTVDRNPVKQGKYLPGSRIPILPPDELARRRPDEVVVLPWNLLREIAADVGPTVRSWGGRFVVPIPSVTVVD